VRWVRAEAAQKMSPRNRKPPAEPHADCSVCVRAKLLEALLKRKYTLP
jgi:hypothetical protein